MHNHIRSKSKTVLWTILAGGLLFPFQNCSQGFRTAAPTDLSSAQCTAKMRADAATLNLDVNCDEVKDYACERRVFSPEVESRAETLSDCSRGACIRVAARFFNTAGAGDSQESYAPGGEYNHEEIHCYHRQTHRGLTLFEGEGDSIESSLAKAMAACKHAVVAR